MFPIFFFSVETSWQIFDISKVILNTVNLQAIYITYTYQQIYRQMTGQTEKWLVITGSLPFLQPSSSCHNKKCPLSMSLGRPI